VPGGAGDAEQHVAKAAGRHDANPPSAVGVRAVGRDRPHTQPARVRRLKLRFSEAELADVVGAARAAGLTPTGYAAEAALAAARDATAPVSEPLRAALSDLIDARAQVRRLATDVHLAVTALHVGGQVPEWLQAAVADAARTVARVDEAAAAIIRSLR
jgi:hypothetical protein